MLELDLASVQRVKRPKGSRADIYYLLLGAFFISSPFWPPTPHSRYDNPYANGFVGLIGVGLVLLALDDLRPAWVALDLPQRSILCWRGFLWWRGWPKHFVIGAHDDLCISAAFSDPGRLMLGVQERVTQRQRSIVTAHTVGGMDAAKVYALWANALDVDLTDWRQTDVYKLAREARKSLAPTESIEESSEE